MRAADTHGPRDGLLAVFDRSTNPMLIADDQRRYTDANDAACHLLKLDREGLTQLRIDDLTPEAQRDSMEEAWQAFLVAGSLAGVFEILTGSGEPILVDYNATANITPGQHLSIFVAVPSGDEPNPLPPIILGHEQDRQAEPNLLTPREREVLGLLALGKTGGEAGAILFISPETVRVHVRNAMRKLGARTRVQAIGIALARGEIGVDPTGDA